MSVPRPPGALIARQNAYADATEKASTSMSGRICWLWLKKLALVTRMRAAQSPARGVKSRSPSRKVKSAATIAATAGGSWAVASVTAPRMRESTAILQGKSGGLLRYCSPSTSAANHTPRRTMSRASNAKRASSDFTMR